MSTFFIVFTLGNIVYVIWSFSTIYKDEYFRATDKNFLKWFRKIDKRVYLTKGTHTLPNRYDRTGLFPITVKAEVDGWYIQDHSEEEKEEIRRRFGAANSPGLQFSRVPVHPKGYILMDEKTNEQYVSEFYIGFQKEVKNVWVRHKNDTITSVVVLVILDALAIGAYYFFS